MSDTSVLLPVLVSASEDLKPMILQRLNNEFEGGKINCKLQSIKNIDIPEKKSGIGVCYLIWCDTIAEKSMIHVASCLSQFEKVIVLVWHAKFFVEEDQIVADKVINSFKHIYGPGVLEKLTIFSVNKFFSDYQFQVLRKMLNCEK